jgi:predicted small metal-binding protein
MVSASCECGCTVSGDENADVARRVREHVSQAHPESYVPPLEGIRKEVAKARAWRARAIILLRPRGLDPRPGDE